MDNKLSLKNKFLLCGLAGWCMEILFTAFESFRRRELRLMGSTSIWMFPIYGMAVCIHPVHFFIHWLPAPLRGMVYAAGIFSVEFFSGTLLKKKNLCPWDYSGAKSSVNGVIRLDYAPFWMVAGLIFERILIGKR